MKLTLKRFDLTLKHPFTIARGTTTVQNMLVVELTDGGFTGYGEAPHYPYYGSTLETMTTMLEAVRDKIEAYDLSQHEPAAFWDHVHPELEKESFAACALDMAAHDLWGKMKGAPVWKLWGLDNTKVPQTDITIGIDTIEVMVKKLHEDPNFDIYKIKLGTPNDIEIVRELRKHTKATLRVDANCAWGVEETIENSKALKELGVEFIEQPMERENWDGMHEVFAKSALPIIADESCIYETDVARCKGLFHGVNVKLVKCGGMTPARRMLKEAESLGLEKMIGCMTESRISSSAIAQLMPMLDYVDNDGPLLIKDDYASGIDYDGGRVIYPNVNGNGVTLKG